MLKNVADAIITLLNNQLESKKQRLIPSNLKSKIAKNNSDLPISIKL